MLREMYYSELCTGSVCQFPAPVFGFEGNGVHRYKKYCLKWVFLQNNPLNRILHLLFSGFLLVTFFATCFMWWEGVKGNRMAASAQ